MSGSKILVKRGYGSTTYASFSEAIVFGLLTFWLFTVFKIWRLLRSHEDDRWAELGREVERNAGFPNARAVLGFATSPRQPIVAAALFGACGLLVCVWFLQWIVFDYGMSTDVEDPFKFYYGLIMGQVAASSLAFYLGAIILFVWATAALRRHEFGEQFLRHGGITLEEFRSIDSSDQMTSRWDRIRQQTTLFLLAAVPLVFTPTYGAHLVVTRQTGEYPVLLVVACFVSAGIFHLWGTALLMHIFNSHLGFERDQLPAAPSLKAANAPAATQTASAARETGATESEPKRCLAAIMLTDMVGYSKAMEADEQATYRKLLEHNKIIRAAIAACNGREVKTIGDAFLALFSSARDAYDCAVAIQEAFMAFNENRTAADQVLVRIGLHLGDVLVTDNDVFGDGVNVAARIEPLAEPGGICVSDELYMMIRKRVEVKVEQLDNPSLKNISATTRVFRVNLRRDV